MKQIRRLVMISFLLILAGCNVREVEFERPYPNMTKLNELRAEKQKERQSMPEYQLHSPLIDSNTPPFELSLLSFLEDNTIESFDIPASDFCWKDVVADCYYLEDSTVLNNTDLKIPEYTVQRKKTLSLHFLSLAEEMPSPSRVEISLYNSEHDRESFGYGMVSNYEYNFDAPEKPGSYIFIFRALYNGAIGGVALFPLIVNVTD